jgi:hypothetical protein
MDLSAKGKKGRVAIVAQPWAQLMGAAKPLDAANAGLEHPGCVVVRLQCPVRHAEGERGNGQGIAARELRRRCCALQDVDPVDRVTLCLGTRAAFFTGPLLGVNGAFFHEYGADRREPGCFQECAPAWTVRPILRHVNQGCLFFSHAVIRIGLCNPQNKVAQLRAVAVRERLECKRKIFLQPLQGVPVTTGNGFC